MPQLASKALPQHVGFIVDGNRRWAAERGLPKLEGHRSGMENLRVRVQQARDLGIKYASAFIFSTENWQRSAEEVAYLMDLFVWFVGKELKKIADQDIKIVFLGSRDRLPEKVLVAMDQAEERTKQGWAMTLGLCLDYGGRQELTDAVKSIVAQGVGVEAITPELIAKYLYHPEVPPVDFLIRTSGEQRISNFMLWRLAYAELYFASKHWPDFGAQDFEKALAEYANRHRRIGK